MTKECLEVIYSEVKEKSQRMNVWKGSRKTKTGKLQDKYIKVVYFRDVPFCWLITRLAPHVAMHVHDNIIWLTYSLLLHSFPEKERAGQADNQRTVCIYSS